jgi:hypothetical protein
LGAGIEHRLQGVQVGSGQLRRAAAARGVDQGRKAGGQEGFDCLTDGGWVHLHQAGDLRHRHALVRQAQALQTHSGVRRKITFVQSSPELGLLLR